MENEICHLPNGDFEVLPTREEIRHKALHRLQKLRDTAILSGDLDVQKSLEAEINTLIGISK